MIKLCSRCKQNKTINEFYKRSKKTKDGLRHECKDCSKSEINEWRKNNKQKSNETLYKWRKDNPERYKSHKIKSYFKHLYGITIEIYNEMNQQQKGLCLICNKVERKLKSKDKFRALSVDHDHKTGKVRGLLCENCNRGLGMFADTPDLLRKAANYLENN